MEDMHYCRVVDSWTFLCSTSHLLHTKECPSSSDGHGLGKTSGYFNISVRKTGQPPVHDLK